MPTAHSDNLRALGTATARATTTPDLAPLPERPTLADFLTLRLHVPKLGLPFAAAPHCVQSATHALSAGLDEETVLGCLLHDLGMGLARPDHGWWGAQLIEPYVSEKVSWAVRYHQALRFYPDVEAGYEYPELYRTLFGPDYQPPGHIQEAYKYARRHKWYMAARSITLFDDYSFERERSLDIEPLIDIIGRHFRQPTEGLGNDRSPAAHMWRTIAHPDRPL
jgi:hypothetical protein